MTTEVIYLMAEDNICPINGNTIIKLTSENYEKRQGDSEYSGLRNNPVALKELAENKINEANSCKLTTKKVSNVVNVDMKPRIDFFELLKNLSAVNVGARGLSLLAEFIIKVIFKLLDLLVFCCLNKYIQNVVYVILTVTFEVFVTLVLAVVAVFAAIIINIDDFNHGNVLKYTNHSPLERQEICKDLSTSKKTDELVISIPLCLQTPLGLPTSIRTAIEKLTATVSEGISQNKRIDRSNCKSKSDANDNNLQHITQEVISEAKSGHIKSNTNKCSELESECLKENNTTTYQNVPLDLNKVSNIKNTVNIDSSSSNTVTIFHQPNSQESTSEVCLSQTTTDITDTKFKSYTILA